MSKVISVKGVSRCIVKSIVNTLFSLNNDVVIYGIARFEAPLKKWKETYGDRIFDSVGSLKRPL
ncbi:Uncharacterized protein RNJ44_00847 [Nakaseomyces bracarensis]|uniref:Uncharacterized protein n=1 Tax=Nakaseomyces bracarensis TaxID=273131 RepID=A0ABR4NSH5_9SACH